MNIKLSQILCKYEEEIENALQSKRDYFDISHQLFNASLTFFTIKQKPHIEIQLFDNFKCVYSTSVLSHKEKDSLIKSFEKACTGYGIFEYPLKYEQWHIFAFLTRKGESMPSWVYFLNDNDGTAHIKCADFRDFLKDISSPIGNANKTFFSEQNIKDIISNFTRK